MGSGQRKAFVEKVFLKGKRIHLGVVVIKVQAVGEAGRDNKRIPRAKRNDRISLTVLNLATGDKTDLVIIVVVGLVVQGSVLNAIDMIMPIACSSL